jgi:ELWxxDGT repeat protein
MTVELFAANDGAQGTELWSTDGTTAHTGIIKDIAPGLESSAPSDFTLFDGQLFFIADVGGSEYLWKTIGTAAGTVAVTSGQVGEAVSQLFAANGALYFGGLDEGTPELFKYDGTNVVAVGEFTISAQTEFAASGSNVFFTVSASTGTYTNLYDTNGSTPTLLTTQTAISSAGQDPSHLTAANNELFFYAQDASGVTAFWVSDGTAAGTKMLEDSVPFDLTAVGSKVFFYTSIAGQFGVWVSDGTAAGTFKVSSGSIGVPNYLTSYNGDLYFFADANNVPALYVSDGTVAGTKVVANNITMESAPVNANGELFFIGLDPNTHDDAVYKSNGTGAGTSLVADMAGVTSFGAMTAVGSKVFFSATDSVHGTELWVSDGTAQGTHLVEDLNPGSASSNPTEITDLNGEALFSAVTASLGTELYISNGTSISLVDDIDPGSASSDPNGFTALPTADPTVSFGGSPPAFSNGSNLTIGGNFSDTVPVSYIDIYYGQILLGSEVINGNENGNWSINITFGAGNYTDIYIVIGDLYGVTQTVLAPFTLQIGITGEVYVAIERDYSDSSLTTLVDERFYRANGSLYEIEYLNITGQAYTSYIIDYNSSNVLLDVRYFGFSGQAYTWEEYDYNSSGVLIDKDLFRADNSLYESFFYNSDSTISISYLGVAASNPAPPAATTADMIMHDGSSGGYEIYDLGSNTVLAGDPLGQISGTEWQLVGVGGFFSTDTTDMIVRSNKTGAFVVFDISNNTVIADAVMGQVGLEWSVAGFGDFSGNAGETDMLMRNSNTGAFEIYDISNNTIYSAAPMGQVGLEWSVAGFGDFSTRPDETDMLMRNVNTGAFYIFDVRDNQLSAAAPMGQVGLEWSVAGFGDFSGNANETDMLMRNVNTGAFYIFDIRDNQLSAAAPMGQVGLEWSVAGFGDFSGNANETDMLMRNRNTGAFEVYDITNNQLTTAAAMGRVGLEWQVAAFAADPPGGSAPANAQLTQAMASFDPAGGALDTSAPIGAPAPAPNVTPFVAAQAPHANSM